MSVKQKIACPYCAFQGFAVLAAKQKQEAVLPWTTRYGCDNGHFFAVPTKSVVHREAA